MHDIRGATASPSGLGLIEAARAPVRRCVVNRDWDRRRFAVVGLVRGHDEGPLAVAAVHVDLGCMGLRHAALRLGSPAASADLLAELLAESGLPPGLWSDCPPGLVAALIDAGADIGWINGVEQSPRFRLVQRLFDAIEPDASVPPVETGHPADGQPLYVPRPEDDGEAIVTRLRHVFGPTGFVVGGEPPLPIGQRYPFDRDLDSLDGAILRAGIIGRRLVAWRTGMPDIADALAAATARARSVGLSDAVAFAAAPWHARIAGRSIVELFATRAPGLSPLDRVIARSWSESAGLRLARLDRLSADGFDAWDPLAGTLRRMVTDDQRVQRSAAKLSPGAMAWVVARPLGDDPRGAAGGMRWFVDRLVPVEGGAAAAERALIAFESAVSLPPVEPLEDTLDRALDAPPAAAPPPLGEADDGSIDRLLQRFVEQVVEPSTAPPPEDAPAL